MPPVAFTYSNAECMDEPDAPQFPRNLTADSVLGIQGIQRMGPESGEEIVPENGQPSTPSKAQAGNTTQFKATKAEPLENSGIMSRNDIQHTQAMPKPSQPMAPSLAPDREMEPVESPVIPEFPGALFNRTTVNIPGTSARTQDFPALSPAEKREPPSIKEEEPPQSPLSLKLPRPSFTANLPPQGQTHQAQTPVGIAHTLEKQPQANNPDAATSAIGSPRLKPEISIQPFFPGKGRLKPRIEDRGLSGLADPMPPPPQEEALETGERRVGAYARRSREKSALNPCVDAPTPINPSADNSRLRSADAIEQLRTAVHELATKRYPQRQQAPNETPPQQPPPPVQQVVIARQPSTQSKIPDAFWERSYLGRVRARILR
jgi:hypothetical protein